jgi:hypothetical protein
MTPLKDAAPTGGWGGETTERKRRGNSTTFYHVRPFPVKTQFHDLISPLCDRLRPERATHDYVC